jgi:hypothetical protein
MIGHPLSSMGEYSAMPNEKIRFDRDLASNLERMEVACTAILLNM